MRLSLALSLLVLAAASTGVARATPGVRPAQELVTLFAAQSVHSAPSTAAPDGVSIAERRPITGVRTVLPVLAHAAGGWLHVLLPGRPNGSTGWIRSRGTRVASTPWWILVELAQRRVFVFRAGRVTATFRAVVGKPSTPTPVGTFFVEEPVRLQASDVGAPFALALSARSDVFQEFDGGPGQIALHGLANVGGVLGTASSHGCIRLDADAMRWLVARIGAGVPVTIVK